MFNPLKTPKTGGVPGGGGGGAGACGAGGAGGDEYRGGGFPLNTIRFGVHQDQL